MKSKISQEDSTDLATAPSTSSVGDVTNLLRFSSHLKENNIAYIVALFVLYQMEFFNFLFTYGKGVCS